LNAMLKDKSMNTKCLLCLLFSFLSLFPAFAQEKTRKELKAELRQEQLRQTEALLNTREFTFIGQTAFLQDGTSVNLTTRSNYVKYHPDLISSSMPYFGKASSNVGLEGDAGIKFEGKPEIYTVKKLKRGFFISAVVKSEGDTYRLKLNIMSDASATLSINSNKRNTILYDGNIWPADSPIY
jgi:hypothetical protein